MAIGSAIGVGGQDRSRSRLGVHENGVLLRAANGTYDVLVTAEKNMHHQQNFTGLDISVLVFPTNRAKLVKAGVSAIAQSLLKLRPGEKTVMDMGAAAGWATAKLVDVILDQGIVRHIFRS